MRQPINDKFVCFSPRQSELFKRVFKEYSGIFPFYTEAFGEIIPGIGFPFPVEIVIGPAFCIGQRSIR